MTDRERWIVYPLLFLALGMAWRDKVAPDKVVRAERIECDELAVVGSNGQPLITLQTSEAGGLVTAIRADGQLRLALGHEGPRSSVFVEARHGTDFESVALLGNLSKYAPDAKTPAEK